MSDFARKVLAIAGIAVALLFGAAMSGYLALRYYFADRFANDFGVYWRAARQPVEQVYLWAGDYPFPYAPTMLLWIEPLSVIPKWPAYFAFISVSLVAFLWALRPYLSKTALLLIVVQRPFLRGLFTGQVCAILAAAIMWACATKNRAAAGVAFAVVGSIKPQLVWLAPLMLLLNKDWRALKGGSVASALILLAAVSFYGVDRWAEWLASMDHFKQALGNINAFRIGISPAMWAQYVGLNPLPFIILGAMGGAVLVYLCRDTGPLEKCTAIIAGSLMGAPYALDYDLVGLFPFLALLVMRGRILAVFGLISPFHPLPLFVTAYELIARLRGDQRNRDNLPAPPYAQGVGRGANCAG